MEDIPLKIRKMVIIDYLNDVPVEKIASELKIPFQDVKDIIDEWRNGYTSIYSSELEISNELKDLARLMKSRELTTDNLIQGYIFSEIFKDLDRDRTLKVIKEIASMDDEKRKEFLNTAEKMMKFSKYKNINYIDIPLALEEMVQKGRELNSQIKELERKIDELQKNIESLEVRKNELIHEERRLSEEIEFSREIENYLNEFRIEKKRLKEFFELISRTDYSLEKWEEIYSAIKALKNKSMDAENFVKISDYLIKLLDNGLTIQFMKNLQNELENQSISIEEYLDEIDKYIKNKISYVKEIEELKKEHKSLENQIRSMRSEIKEYFKKIKPKMQ